ncbi:MAG TPA: alpha/beta hydrolase [Methylomirabilota bacterium]|jgi:pimeloyl-ACP methyl ester carboxylesterase|nr:alpha/beta hydrolase [Methylomirabilota bacterium]
MSTDFPPARLVSLPAGAMSSSSAEPGLTLSIHEAGTGPAVVLCHGFPELAYSWRHQLPALAAAGFRVIAPDQRGYGGSDAPAPVEAYDLEHLAADLVALLDVLEIDRAIFVGHDWGGFVSWAMPVLHPARVAGAIGVNTPYIPFPTTEMLRKAYPDPEKLYILWFQTPGVAEGVLDRHPRLVFEKLMRRGVAGRGSMLRAGREGRDANPFRRLETLAPMGPSLLSEEEIDVYTRAYAARGFRGPISWYRNIDRNRARFPEIGGRKLDLPCLMITAEWDFALPPELAAGMPALCSDLETHLIPECGHWTQQEKPEELNRLLLDWLVRRFR